MCDSIINRGELISNKEAIKPCALPNNSCPNKNVIHIDTLAPIADGNLKDQRGGLSRKKMFFIKVADMA